MTRLLLLATVFACCLAASAREAMPLTQDPATEQRMLELSGQLRCLVCQNESLADSHADLAEDLRGQIRELIRAGKTDQEIVDYMVSRYGDFVRFRPPLKPATWLLWFGPFVLMAGALAWLMAYLRQRARRLAGGEPGSEDSSDPGVSPAPHDAGDEATS